MLRKPSSIMPISNQLKSSSWLISSLIHVALIALVSEIYITKTNHKNDGLQAFEFIIYQPEPSKLPQTVTPKDIAKADPKVKPKTVSKQSDVSKPSIISEARIISQSKSVSKQKVLSLEISENKLKSTPKPKPAIIAIETSPTKNPSQKTALTNASFGELASKNPEHKDKHVFNDKAPINYSTNLDAKLSAQLAKPAPQNLGLAIANENKSPTKQMGMRLIKTLTGAPDTEQIQAKIFESKNANYSGKINNKKTSIVDLSEKTPNTETTSVNAKLSQKNQSIMSQTKFSTPTTELAIRKKLLKNWATTIRDDIVERTLESKLSSDVRISFKISRTGEILDIETIGLFIRNESIKKFIDVIRKPGKFPGAPHSLKLDYVTFPVNFRRRG
tara:strand:+ start:3156 stop:4319 length:1164 start_codon:yes stop_codon:yes gene_type:complete